MRDHVRLDAKFAGAQKHRKNCVVPPTLLNIRHLQHLRKIHKKSILLLKKTSGLEDGLPVRAYITTIGFQCFFLLFHLGQKKKPKKLKYFSPLRGDCKPQK